MAAKFDIVKILDLITENESPDVVERIAQKIVEQYPTKSSQILNKMALEEEFNDNFVTITSANTLTTKQKSLIEKVLNPQKNKNLQINYLVKEDLLGGIIIQRGETVVDNTLRSRVDQIVDSFKQTRFNIGAEDAK